MHRRPFIASRNKLDLGNRVQVRIVRKRLKISEQQLNNLVRKAGDSIAAVRKEANSRQLLKLPQVHQAPTAAIVHETTKTENQEALF